MALKAESINTRFLSGVGQFSGEAQRVFSSSRFILVLFHLLLQFSAGAEQSHADQVFVDATGNVCPTVKGATAGLVGPGDETWKRLIAAVPKEFNDLRVPIASKTVYVAGTSADRLASAASPGHERAVWGTEGYPFGITFFLSF